MTLASHTLASSGQAATRVLIDDWLPGELRAFALRSDGKGGECLLDCLVLRDSLPILSGAVFRARVKTIDRGLRAAFLDLAASDLAPAFLPLKTGHGLGEGDPVLVRVTRDPTRDKSPRVALLDDQSEAGAGAPGLLRAADPLMDWLSDLGALREVVVARPDLRGRLAQRFPEIVTAPRQPLAMIPEGLEEAFAALLEPSVPLAGGGALRIDVLPGMVAVDVDSGGRDGRSGPEALALDCDLAAALRLAPELRRRGLSGLILVDFLGLETKAARRKVEAALTQAFAEDPAVGEIEPMRASGLVALTRRRLRPSLIETLGEACGLGGGGWRLSAESEGRLALRALLRAGLAEPAARPVLVATPSLAFLLEAGATLATARAAVEERLGRPLEVRPWDTTLDGGGSWPEGHAWRLRLER